jgi:predicted TIM-barrel fold metal-dependent hydrolase
VFSRPTECLLLLTRSIGGSADFPIHLGNPLQLAKVLRKYPGLRIYIENASWPFLEEVTSLMYQYPSVYVDISTILHLTPRNVAYAYLKGLVDNGLGKRVMYGSDQMIWPEVIGENIEESRSRGGDYRREYFTDLRD